MGAAMTCRAETPEVVEDSAHPPSTAAARTVAAVCRKAPSDPARSSLLAASRGTASPHDGRRVQASLKISQPGDRAEREADAMADAVMAMRDPVPRAGVRSHKCAACAGKEKLQRREAGPQGAGEAPASVQQVVGSSGRPLDGATRAYFEPRFGQDFGHVRVHVGGRAAESAQGVNAHAYTLGHNIVFDAGRFAPGTSDGRRLIAHELAHVVQQSAGPPTVQRQPKPVADSTAGPPPAPIPLEEQLDAQLDAEKALRLNWSKRKEKSYAWSVGLKDRDRIRKASKLSPKLQQEITTKIRFFEGEAKAAYIRTIGPALEEFPEESVDVLAPPPTTEKPCPIDQTILVYQGKPGQGRCITENDSEFRQNYIDNNIVQADALATPNTTWGNVDHDRVPQIQLTYRDGRTLLVNVKDVPKGDSSRKSGSTSVRTFVARYEKRSDGFIYPIRSAGETYYVSYLDAPNIRSLRAGLFDRIEELKLNLAIMEAGAAFAGSIAALGGVASMGGQPGGLFQRVPRKQTGTRTTEPPVPPTRGKTEVKKAPKPTTTAKNEEERVTVVTRSDDDSTGFKGEKKPPKTQSIGKGQREEPSPKVAGKKRDEAEDFKGGKMTKNPWATEPSLSGRAIDHVFVGDEHGGYHSRARGPNPNVNEIKVRQKPDANGVYKLKIEIRSGGSVRTKDSTMFPDTWTEGRILSETYAVMRANPPAPNARGIVVSRGVSPSGVVIQIDYFNGEPASFYPVHTKDL